MQDVFKCEIGQARFDEGLADARRTVREEAGCLETDDSREGRLVARISSHKRQ
jgi:hypothetical protein